MLCSRSASLMSNTRRSCHRDEHLAHRRRLLCLPRIKLQAVELGHTVNNRGNVFAEISAQVIKRKFSIFNRACNKAVERVMSSSPNSATILATAAGGGYNFRRSNAIVLHELQPQRHTHDESFPLRPWGGTYGTTQRPETNGLRDFVQCYVSKGELGQRLP